MLLTLYTHLEPDDAADRPGWRYSVVCPDSFELFKGTLLEKIFHPPSSVFTGLELFRYC
jgi:hypothetical protein